MEFTLEQARPEHIPQISAIWEAGWHEAHGKITPPALTRLRTSQSFLDRSGEYLSRTRVAVSGAEVHGFCMVKSDELYQMYVASTARGTGIAQALIADAEATIRAAGHPKAWLSCAIGNEQARRFYEKSGWLNAGEQVVNMDTQKGPFPLTIWQFEKVLRGA